MKKFLVVMSAFILVIAAGCKSKTTDSKAGAGTDVSSVSDANNIIDYTNDIIDVMKKYNETTKSTVEYYEKLEDKISGRTSFAPVNINRMSFLFTVDKKAKNAFGKPPAALGDNQTFFKDSLGAYQKFFKEFQANDSTLELYVKAEDFKDDKFAKGSTLIDRQYELYDNMARLKSGISDKIDIIGDAAEAVALKDSPIKDAYDAAKNDLRNMEKTATLIFDKEKYTDADIAAIDATYNALAASVEKNKALDKTNLNKENKASAYDRYYTSMVENIAEMKPVIRNIKEKKRLSESDYDKVDRIYSSTISDYNSWVN